MQPVLHCIDYYQHLIDNFQLSTKIRRAYKISGTLWDRKNHYQTINGNWSWTARTKFTSADQHEIPFDPPYRTIRHEDAYNKLLEAGAIDEDEIENPEPTALQHYIDRTNNKT